MEIKEKLTKVNYWSGNGAGGSKNNEYIVIHYVGAVSTASNNASYFENTNRGSSAHYFVDENEVYRVVKDLDTAWHCGTTGTYKHSKCRNSNSIGIEMCCFNNNGSIDVSESVVARTIELTKTLMQMYGIPESNVIRHYDVTGKNCPAPFVSNPSRWSDFKNKLGGSVTPTPTPTPTPQPTPSGNQTLTLPASAEKWAIYDLNVAPVKKNVKAYLYPSKFGGLTYDILGWTQTDVAVIQTRDYGRVQIYVASSTGAIIKNKDAAPTPSGSKKLYLPSSAESWRIYPLNKEPVKGNECGYLKPSKFGGLTYDILRYTKENVAVINTRDYGEVQIYVAPSTGAVIK